MAYSLGPVKPHVAKAAVEVGARFNVGTIYGYGTRDNPTDHDDGLALDFMVYADTDKGDSIAAYGQANAERLGITYIIWKQRIWHTGDADWEAMGDRGNPTANHEDHNHWSFTGDGKATKPGAPVEVREDGSAWLSDANKAASWLGDSHSWQRIGMVAGGSALILVGIWKMSKGI